MLIQLWADVKYHVPTMHDAKLETLEAPETPETPEAPETPVEKHDFKELGAKIMVRRVYVNTKRVK